MTVGWDLAHLHYAPILLAVGCAQDHPRHHADEREWAEPEIQAKEGAGDAFPKSQLASRPTTPPRHVVADTVYFEFDQATLSDTAKDTLVRNAQWSLQCKRPCSGEGNADGVLSTNEYSLALGERRAASVEDTLIVGHR
jgi:outer membrane protein OmpA-like peptidoglycan-associated protein